MSDLEIKNTPLAECHKLAGAKMVPFSGWNMPVQYSDGILAEHKHTREKAGNKRLKTHQFKEYHRTDKNNKNEAKLTVRANSTSTGAESFSIRRVSSGSPELSCCTDRASVSHLINAVNCAFLCV